MSHVLKELRCIDINDNIQTNVRSKPSAYYIFLQTQSFLSKTAYTFTSRLLKKPRDKTTLTKHSMDSGTEKALLSFVKQEVVLLLELLYILWMILLILIGKWDLIFNL